MTDLYLILFFVSLICLVLGLVRPDILSCVIKKELTRKSIALIFGWAMIISFVLIGITEPTQEPEPKNDKIKSFELEIDEKDFEIESKELEIK